MKKILSLIGAITLVGASSANLISCSDPSPKNKYNNLYVLGDSLSDTGCFAGAGDQFLKYITFSYKNFKLDDLFYKNRSFTNGPVAVEYLAKALNFNLTAGWDFSVFYDMKEFSQIGNNYAFVGSGCFEGNTWGEDILFNRFALENQYDSLIKQHDLKSNDLVLVESGSNDVMTILENTSLTDIQKENNIINAADINANVVEKILQNGVNYVMDTNVANIGSAPKYNSNPQEINKLVSIYNAEWDKKTRDIDKKYPNKLRKININYLFDKLLKKFKEIDPNNDIKNATIGENFWSILDGEISAYYKPNKNKDSFDHDFFFDFIHPTKWVHEQIGKVLISQALDWNKQYY